jgi:hypothetical protein
MSEEIEQRLFEVARGQDQIMHSLSAEMSVKTSLYLVFTAFIFSASIQIINFSKDVAAPCSRIAIKLSGTSAAFSLLAGVMLLIAALMREYKIFPTRKMVAWVKALGKYKSDYPDEETITPSEGVLNGLIDTAEQNKTESEKKAAWITAGALFLFIAVAFLALGGGFGLYAFFSRPS